MLLCLLPLMLSTDSSNLKSPLSTSGLELEEELETKPQDLVLNLPLELLLVMASKSAESRIALPSPPILPEEKEVEKVADFDLLMDYFRYIFH
jgi:hypothetical protein